MTEHNTRGRIAGDSKVRALSRVGAGPAKNFCVDVRCAQTAPLSHRLVIFRLRAKGPSGYALLLTGLFMNV